MAQGHLPTGYEDLPPVAPFRHANPGVQRSRPDLQEALTVIGQRKWSIAAVTLIVVGLALSISAQQVPVYESTSGVLVRSVDFDPSSSTASAPNLATEVNLAESTAVAEVAAELLGGDLSLSKLVAGLTVDFPPETEILTFAYQDSDPAVAQKRAQTFAEAYLEYRRRTITNALSSSAQSLKDEIKVLVEREHSLERQLEAISDTDPRRSSLEAQLSLVQGVLLQTQLDQLSLQGRVNVGSIVDPAVLPTSPVSPNHVANASFALIAGLALGIGLAFLRDKLSGRLRTVPEIEFMAGTGVLGTIPQIPTWNKKKIPLVVTRSDWRSPAAEAYRILRTNLLSLAANQDVRSVLVSSPRPGEGKTATVANLGFVLAGAGKRVILVSADLRRPRLDQFFDLHSRMGLTDVLMGKTDNLEQALFPVQPTAGASGTEWLKVMPSGSSIEDPAELLSRGAMQTLLKDLEQRADLVLIDTPPLLPVTDALVIAPMVSGALIVLGPRSVTSGVISSVRQQLAKVGANTLGLVLNGQEPSTMSAYYGY